MASEKVILVDSQDREIGTGDKEACHDGEGILHRAFSVFLFDAEGAVLLQQRSDKKRLWPGFWSNSCCSHPRPGEDVRAAGERRIAEELSLEAPLSFLYKFVYQARFSAAGSEHELCHVYAGRTQGPVVVNPDEVAAWRFVAPVALDRELASEPERFTPWFKMEWQRIRTEHADWLLPS